MTPITQFGALKTLIRQQIWPAGEAEELVPAHDRYFVEAMLDLQQSVECLQYNNTSIFPHCTTYFQCGMTLLAAPKGVIRKVYTVDQINQTTGREDASVGTDWCSRVDYDQTKFCNLEHYVSQTIACASGSCGTGPSLSSLFALPAGLCRKNTFVPPTDAGWEGFDALPQGLHYPQESTDSTCGRSHAGVWALRRGRLYVAPWIQSTEQVVVEWDGIKSEWVDEDTVEADGLLQRAIRYYVQAQHARDYDNEFDKSALLWNEYMKARSELMYNCREETRVRGCEESHAQQSVSLREMVVRSGVNSLDPTGSTGGGAGSGAPTLPENQIITPPDETTCAPVAEVIFDPPAGAIVTWPIWVVMTCATPGASIYYTLDGSTPTTSSTKYIGPVKLDELTITARAVLSGCLGPVAVAGYESASEYFNIEPVLTTLCDTTDRSGPWFVFNPNGRPDINWTLSFTPTGQIPIRRLELYETNAAGLWDTGRVWATDYTIHPGGGAAFNSYPLIVDEGGAQLNTAYLAMFGTFSGASHLWELFGELAGVPPTGKFYKLIIFREDGKEFYATSDIICSDDCVYAEIGQTSEGVTTAEQNGITFSFSNDGDSLVLAGVSSVHGPVQTVNPALGSRWSCSPSPFNFFVVVGGVTTRCCFQFPCVNTTTTTTTTTSSTSTCAEDGFGLTMAVDITIENRSWFAAGSQEGCLCGDSDWVECSPDSFKCLKTNTFRITQLTRACGDLHFVWVGLTPVYCLEWSGEQAISVVAQYDIATGLYSVDTSHGSVAGVGPGYYPSEYPSDCDTSESGGSTADITIA